MANGCGSSVSTGSTSMSRDTYAHSLPDRPVDHWQRLTDHLRSVAEKAGNLRMFSMPHDGNILRDLHDIGESPHEFQGPIRASDPDAHIENVRGALTISTAGAQHAYKVPSRFGQIVVPTLCGSSCGPGRREDERSVLFSEPSEEEGIRLLGGPAGHPCLHETTRSAFGLDSQRAAFQLSFFTRMLYSCLVDADFLDTEKFLQNRKSRIGGTAISLFQRCS